MKKRIICALAAAFCSATAFADSPYDWRINAFLSVGAAWADVDYLPHFVFDNNLPLYVSFINNRVTFNKDSNVGIQFTKYLTDEVSFTVQLLAEAAFDDWFVNASWAFLKYEPNDHWQFRAGRLRTNPYMLSDYVDVAYAYPWIRPPQEVYSQIPLDFTNVVGVDLRVKYPICARDLAFTIFYGQSSVHLNFPCRPNHTVFDRVDTKLNNLVSMNLKYGDEVFSVRAGYETTHVTFYPNAGTFINNLNTFMNSMVTGLPPNPPFPGFLPILNHDYYNYFRHDFRASFMGAGYQFDWCNIVSMGEIVKRSSQSVLMPNAIGWYLMGGYRIKRLLPNITFARERVLYGRYRRFPDAVNFWFQNLTGSPINLDAVTERIISTSPYFHGGAGDQTSVTYGIRWDVMDGVALKAELSHVHPDNNTPGLFDINPCKSVNIYSLALNAAI